MYFRFPSSILLLAPMFALCQLPLSLPADASLSDLASGEPTAGTWEDSLEQRRSTLLLVARASGDSTRFVEAFEGPCGPGLEAQLRRKQPGAWSRRSLRLGSEFLSATVGDLSPWSQSPLVEGRSRGLSSSGRGESETFLWGDGSRPNGVDLEGAIDGWSVRARLREDLSAGSEPIGSGSLLLSRGGISLGLRSQDPHSGSARHVASCGWTTGRFGSWLGAASSGGFGAALRLDSSEGSFHIRGSIRWIGAGFRHDGLPSQWSGASAADAAAFWRLEELATTRARVQFVRDSADRVLSRVGLFQEGAWDSRYVPSFEGRCDRGRRGMVAAVHIGVRDPGGKFRPEATQGWVDSAGQVRPTSRAGFSWSTGDGVLRGRGSWDWSRSRGAVSLSRESRMLVGSLAFATQILASRDLSTGALGGQGRVECAW